METGRAHHAGAPSGESALAERGRDATDWELIGNLGMSEYAQRFTANAMTLASSPISQIKI
jgi:hypothetical protein